MRIVHVVRQFHPSVGGLEAVVMELAMAQLAQGHDIRIVTLDRLFGSNERLAAAESVGGLDVVRIPFSGSTRYPIAPSVLKFIKAADLVHVHAIDFFFDYLAWTKPFHRKPLVASTHGGFFHTAFAATLKRIYFNVITRLSAAWYDAIVAVSSADQDLFAKISSKVVCIENGVNIQRFLAASAEAPAKKIIAVGRFSSNKRLDRLISFLAKLRARDPAWTLLIAGRRSDLTSDELASLAQTAGVGNAATIVDSPADDALRGIMQSCSVIASSSEYEGFGLTAVEGMAAGLFPLLSDIPPFRHLVSRTGVGILVDFSNPDEAATNFLRRWEQVKDSYPSLRAAAIESARIYDWSSVAASYDRLYEQVLRTR
jgi:alpha-1,3-mannosyltransferase